MLYLLGMLYFLTFTTIPRADQRQRGLGSFAYEPSFHQEQTEHPVAQ